MIGEIDFVESQTFGGLEGLFEFGLFVFEELEVVQSGIGVGFFNQIQILINSA